MSVETRSVLSAFAASRRTNRTDRCCADSTLRDFRRDSHGERTFSGCRSVLRHQNETKKIEIVNRSIVLKKSHSIPVGGGIRSKSWFVNGHKTAKKINNNKNKSDAASLFSCTEHSIWSSIPHTNHCSRLHPSHSQLNAVVKMEGHNNDIRNSVACGVKDKDTEEQRDLLNVQEESEELTDMKKKHQIQDLLDAKTREKKGQKISQRAEAKKSITCPLCGKSFSCNSVFIVHTRRHTGEKPFTCPQCGKSFINKGNLSSHMQIHNEERPFTCDECGKGFKWPYSLRVHKLIHSGEKPFDCDQCDKKFLKESILKGHMKVHTKEKPYLCSDCGKTFSWLGRFKDHQKIHSGLKDYLCSDCGKAFTTATQLKVHQRTHTGERPYKCSYCEKRFKQMGTLQGHERIHTGEKPYQCHQCGKRFNCFKTTQIHSKKHCPKLNGMSAQL